MRPKGEPKTAKIVRLPPALIEAVDATITLLRKESFNAYVTRLIREDLGKKPKVEVVYVGHGITTGSN